MSLSSGLSSIKNPNLALLWWFESIEDENRRREIFLDVGRQLQRQGIPNKIIDRVFLQLANKPIVSLPKLIEAEILSFCCNERGRATPVSSDEDNDNIYKTYSDGNNSETDNEIQEPQENNAAEPLNNVPAEDNNGLKESNAEDRPTVIEKSQDSTEVSNPEETTEIRSSVNLTPLSALQESNVEESISVTDTYQKDQSITGEEISFKESNTVQSIGSLAVKYNVKEINVEEKSVVNEKSEGNSSQDKTDTYTLQVVSEKVNDDHIKDTDSNHVNKTTDEFNINNFQLDQQANDQPGIDECAPDKDLEIESCTTKNLEDAPINDPPVSKEISKEGGLPSVTEEFETSSIKIKPPTSREVVLMKSLREKLSIKLNKKNIHLPVSSINMQPAVTGGEITIPAQSVVKQAEENGQKPLISVRKNLFEHRNEETLKYPEVNSMQINTTSVVGLVSGDCSTNTNIRQPYFEGSSKSGGDKFKEQNHREENSKPSSTLGDPSKLKESLKQMNEELHKIKKIAESRKRFSQDSGEKIKTVKKRRFSEQGITSKAQETNMQEKEVENNNKSAKEVLRPQELTVSNGNINTHQPLSWKNPKSNPTTNLSGIMLSEGNKMSVTVTQNKTQNEGQNPPEITIRSILNTSQPQPLNRPDANAGKMNTISSQITSSEGNKTSLNMAMKTGQKSSTGKTLNQSISNLYRRQSLDCAQVVVSNPLLASQPTTHPNIALEKLNSVTDGTILVSEHSSSTVTDRSYLASRTCRNYSGENNLGSESLAVPNNLNNQSSSNMQTSVSGVEQTAPVTSNQPTIVSKTTREVNQIVEKACLRYLIYFCDRSDDNLGAVPAEFRSCLKQYCIDSKRSPFIKVTEFLKVYMLLYFRFFNSEEISKIIAKIAEHLHLSIADSIRRKERREQAEKLQSSVLREEEISRANKDYDDILVLRGGQFTEMFMSLVPKINHVKSCDYLMLVTLYFKITQALMKIDRENEAYVFSVRELMKQLLMSGRKPLPFPCWSLFEHKIEDFKTNCLFVKQCLLTLYVSGYIEAETESFWRLVSCKPTAVSLQQIIHKLYPQPNSTTQTVGSSSCTSENILRTDTHQIPMNVRLQTTAETRSGPSQFMKSNQSVNVPNVAVQQRTHHVQQPQAPPMVRVGIPSHHVQQAQASPMVRVGIPSQLPPFASLNHPHLLYHHLTQRTQAASSNLQANQGYHPSNRGLQQAAKNSSSTSSQAQLSRNVGTAPKPNYYPPPSYQPRVSTETNQLWQPGGTVNNNSAPVTNHLEMVEDANLSYDDMAQSISQVCTTPRCSKLATLVCSLCRSAVYCTTDCQAQDWYDNHSKICLQ